MKYTNLYKGVALGVLIFIVGFIFIRTPVISGLFEHFDSQQVKAVAAVCPKDFTMYMYEGTAYCCRGSVNSDASTLKGTCMPPVTQIEGSFCTLGSASSVPNCAAFQSALLAQQGAVVCPPSKPNFCSANRCCADPVTSDGTDCTNKTVGTYCDVGSGPLFSSASDCRYQRMKETDICPMNFSKTDVTVPSGPLAGLTIYGCVNPNLSSTCYTPSLISALKGMGKDTSLLTVCA